MKPLQIKFIAKEALKLIRAPTPATIEIRQDIRSDSLVMGDPTQIHQIFMNLCTNAVYAMEEEGGVMEVSLMDVVLDAASLSGHPEIKPGPFVKLTVSDTGHGIPTEVLDRVFDPFFTTKRKEEGTGLGLSMVHGIVRSHGGVVAMASEEGKGATFDVFLPVVECTADPEIGIDEPLPRGTEWILFVDDEPPLANLGKQMLESLGYHVVAKTSSMEALEAFKAGADRFDLVITDLTMPHMTGDRLAGEFMAVRPDIPVILCTGFSTRMDEKKAAAMGIQAFVLKPILKQDMARTIRRLLDG